MVTDHISGGEHSKQSPLLNGLGAEQHAGRGHFGTDITSAILSSANTEVRKMNGLGIDEPQSPSHFQLGSVSKDRPSTSKKHSVPPVKMASR